jgi:hypothetical protein
VSFQDHPLLILADSCGVGIQDPIHLGALRVSNLDILKGYVCAIQLLRIIGFNFVKQTAVTSCAKNPRRLQIIALWYRISRRLHNFRLAQGAVQIPAAGSPKEQHHES